MLNFDRKVIEAVDVKATRKPDKYSKAREVSPTTLSASAQLFLTCLEHFGLPKRVSDTFQTKVPQRFIGHHGKSIYYVNTEGYDYPRYLFKIGKAHGQG